MLIEAEDIQELSSSGNGILLCSLLKPVGAPVDSVVMDEFIPESRVFDIDAFSESGVDYPHTLLSSDAFQSKARKLGMNNASSIVVYDNIGIYSSPRVWFNLKLMGCKEVVLLNGGLPRWKMLDYPIVTELEMTFQLGDFKANKNSNMLASKEDVLSAISKSHQRIIDVRSSARFYGEEPEPRQGLRRGHIPSSLNIPFANFIDGHRFKETEALLSIFKDLDCDINDELIFSCGSGVTACIGYFAASLCGYKNIRVYDGSWAEWGSIEELPIETS